MVTSAASYQKVLCNNADTMEPSSRTNPRPLRSSKPHFGRGATLACDDWVQVLVRDRRWELIEHVVLTYASRRQLLAQLNRWRIRKQGSGQNHVSLVLDQATAIGPSTLPNTTTTLSTSMSPSRGLGSNWTSQSRPQDEQARQSLTSSRNHASIDQDDHFPSPYLSCSNEGPLSRSWSTPRSNIYFTELECGIEILNSDHFDWVDDPATLSSNSFNDAYFVDWTTL